MGWSKRDNGEGVLDREAGGGGGAYFWHLKDDSPQPSSSASLLSLLSPFSSFLSAFLARLMQHNNNKAASVNSGCDIYFKIGVLTYNRY